MKTKRPNIYIFSNNNKNLTERGNPGKRQKGKSDIKSQKNMTSEAIQVDELEKPILNLIKREPS